MVESNYMTHTLALLRHGQSTWNLEDRFTGWHNCPLSEHGRQEAEAAGVALKAAGLVPDVVHTSVLMRAVDTAKIAMEILFGEGCQATENQAPSKTYGSEISVNSDAPVPLLRDWRLNERHYGNLTGLNKAETREKFGEEQVQLWRRSYRVAPPPLEESNVWNPNHDPLYKGIENLPLTECLADVSKRIVPFFEEVIVPDLLGGLSSSDGHRSDLPDGRGPDSPDGRGPGLPNGRVVLVVAHGNSLRALVKHLDEISESGISQVNIPTGVPLIYNLASDMTPVEKLPLAERYLEVGDPGA